MSELRHDPIKDTWVIVADDRANRPRDLTDISEAEIRSCPFCPGNESMTPPPIVTRAELNEIPSDWSLRVVPNSYAALRIEGALDPRREGLYERLNGVGAHEVIIESANHEGRLGDYTEDKLEQIIGIYLDRTIDLFRDRRFLYVQIFRNYGAQAGASLRHPHSQLIALPIAPKDVHEEMDSMRGHFEAESSCLLCSILEQEGKDRRRVIDENEAYMAIAPFASALSYEITIIPKKHNHDFQYLRQEDIPYLARILKRVARALQEALNDPPFNLMIHSAPGTLAQRAGGTSMRDYYHWHIEIMPRLTNLAGFEFGTGFHINDVSPEAAAEKLRAALP